MVLTNQVIILLLGVGFIVALAFLIGKLMKDPKNKGKEIGLIIGELMIAYPMSWFFSFLLAINVAEAILAASFASSEVSPLARMLMHSVMGLLSVFAGLVWIKEINNFASAIKARSITDAFISIGLVAITFFLTFFTPLLNLIVIANNLNQITHVSLLWHRLLATMHIRTMRSYHAEVYGNGFDIATYSSFQALDGIMIATIGGTIVHILLVVWEALKIARSRRESTRDVLNSDQATDPKKEEPKKEESKKDEEKPKEKKEEDKEGATSSTLTKIFKFLGYQDDHLESIKKSALKVISNSELKMENQAEIAKTLGNLLLEIEGWKAKGKDTTDKKALDDKIISALRKSPRQGGLGMTLKAKNE